MLSKKGNLTSTSFTMKIHSINAPRFLSLNMTLVTPTKGNLENLDEFKFKLRLFDYKVLKSLHFLIFV